MTYVPAEREIEALSAYLEHGTCKGAGESMGITEQAVKMIFLRFRQRSGANSIGALVFLYYEELAA